MTAAEWDAEVARYDFSGVAEAEAEALAGQPMPRHPKKRRVGRPAKPVAAKAARVLITVEPKLLKRADAYVEKTGQTRAGWIQSLMRTALKER